MKFDEKFPNAQINDEPIPLIWKCPKPFNCAKCGDMTHWVEISFQGHFCSEECVDAMWNEFNEALSRINEGTEAQLIIEPVKAPSPN